MSAALAITQADVDVLVRLQAKLEGEERDVIVKLLETIRTAGGTTVPDFDTAMPETKVGDRILVTNSWALGGIMVGNQYEVTSVDGPFVGVSNSTFFSGLNWDDGDRWEVRRRAT